MHFSASTTTIASIALAMVTATGVNATCHNANGQVFAPFSQDMKREALQHITNMCRVSLPASCYFLYSRETSLVLLLNTNLPTDRRFPFVFRFVLELELEKRRITNCLFACCRDTVVTEEPSKT